jgi:hypothetical protein
MDHYPWDSFEAERAALIADLCAQLGVPPPPAPPTRFVKFGDSMVCTRCQLDVRYCRGHVAPLDDREAARDQADLDRRARECRGGR